MKTENGIIYGIFCLENGKYYIGQTWQTIEERWKQHLLKTSECYKLVAAIEKYGKDRFTINPLTQWLTSQEDMDAAECYWIDYFDSIKNGYNIKQGGSRGRHSEETKAKMSDVHKDRVFSEEHKKALSEAAKGRKVSKETKRKLSLLNLGHTHSDETKAKMSKTRKGRKFSEEHKKALSEAAKNRKHTKKTRAKIRAGHIGKKASDETKAKMSEAQKARWERLKQEAKQ